MAAAVFKSCVYLVGFGSLGYLLMKISEPSEEKRKAIARTGGISTSDEVTKKKALFLQKLKEASTDTPIYLKKTEKTEETSKQPSRREIN